MSKNFHFVTLDESAPSADELDWSKCIFCQSSKKETLRCPATSSRFDSYGYEKLAENLNNFQSINALPKCLNFSKTNTVELKEMLTINCAKFHQTCRLKYNDNEYKRIQKRNEKSKTGESSRYLRSKETISSQTEVPLCFFCDQVEASEPFHEVSSLSLDKKIRQIANDIGDSKLIAKLSTGDMIALKAKYHLKCLATFYKKATNTEKQTEENRYRQKECMAFADLVVYLNDLKMNSSKAPVFKLANVVKMYNEQLQKYGIEDETRVNSTRLKERLLRSIPDLEAYTEGRDIILAFNKDIGLALKRVCECDDDENAMILTKAAGIVRKEMFSMKNQFDGAFTKNCQENSVPIYLLNLIEQILKGTGIRNESSENKSSVSRAACSISQLIMFNSKEKGLNDTNENPRSNLDRETPLPIYLGVMIHSKTRKRSVVDRLFELGICISYNRVLSISTDLGNKLCDFYGSVDTVCPPNMIRNVFTLAAVDNIDHNPSSATAKSSFHGTGISLFQNSVGRFGQESFQLSQALDRRKQLSSLPDSYTRVLPLSLGKKTANVPCIPRPNSSDFLSVQEASQKEFRWLDHVKRNNDSSSITNESNLSWSAYHAEYSTNKCHGEKEKGATCLLPLFYDVAHSEAMISHSMKVVQKAVALLNGNQTPIIAMDQPLFAIAKKIQWAIPSTYGEDKFVVMFGGLHIEMAAFKMLGDILLGSGWTTAISEAGVASLGTADSFLKASHVTKTRHAHQISAASLYLLLNDAYTASIQAEGVMLSLEEWCCLRNNESPQFKYWYQILLLEIDVLIFIRSIRDSDFSLYKDSLANLAPWFFALDHTNYARWIPVHLRDMDALAELHPDVNCEFNRGNFTVRKTTRDFSALAIDQAHEQNNALVKGDGGAVGLTENPSALKRWMLCGPEMARLVSEFEGSSEVLSERSQDKHHEQTKASQTLFVSEVSALKTVIEEMGNPFSETGSDLIILDTRDIVEEEVKEAVLGLAMLGQNQFDSYVKDRLESNTVGIEEPIKRNNITLLGKSKRKTRSDASKQISALKNDCSLFSRLYVSCQIRSGNLEEFFCHENQSYPPSIASNGQLKGGKKSDLIGCLMDKSNGYSEVRPVADAVILDGAAIVHFLKPLALNTFSDYSCEVFGPYLCSQLRDASRCDVIWDRYQDDSLKTYTRVKRGTGQKRQVEGGIKIPKDWNEFLKREENKEQLFSYLGMESVKLNVKGQIISTHNDDVLVKDTEDTSKLSKCNHEEADSRIFVHVSDCATKGLDKIVIRTVDTDVVVLAVAVLAKVSLNELWIAFGVGKQFQYIAAHEIFASLGPSKSLTLPMFHALTGCDTVSFFHGKGKKSAWQTWNSMEDLTNTFAELLDNPESLDVNMPMLERFVILMYDRTSSEEDINNARKIMFAQKGRELDKIPPTRDALIQHVRRAILQASFVWHNMTNAMLELPSPSEWGWIKGQDSSAIWSPKWMLLPPVVQTLSELLKCGCTRGCGGHCKCKKAELPCTSLCKCDGCS